LGGSLGIFLAVEGNKGKSLASVVDIGNHSELLELGLQVPVGHVLVYPVDEEFTALLCHDDDDVWILCSLDSVL
jgi:hypothetical protein